MANLIGYVALGANVMAISCVLASAFAGRRRS